MFDMRSIELLHRHGDDEWHPMEEQGIPDAASRDRERGWLSGGRLFKCSACDSEVVVRVPGLNGDDFGRPESAG